jgi:F0F1-type ATP synthase assembly protein I
MAGEILETVANTASSTSPWGYIVAAVVGTWATFRSILTRSDKRNDIKDKELREANRKELERAAAREDRCYAMIEKTIAATSELTDSHNNLAASIRTMSDKLGGVDCLNYNKRPQA